MSDEPRGLEIEGRGGVAVASVVSALESGEAAESLAPSAGIAPVDVLAALALAALGDAESLGPAARSSSSRPGPGWPGRCPSRRSPASSRDASRTAVLAVSAGLLQVHDFWDASHAAAQEADDLGESRFSAYWHGIGHRREPDAGNAAYWFRRVGRHPLFPALAEAAGRSWTTMATPRLAARLLGQGGWNPRP